MAETPGNSLLSESKASDSHLLVQLHPLVILNISDYVTRHALRKQAGPVAGAILGSQNGREITMEHAFDCKLEVDQDGNAVFDASWFHARLQQYKDVHKAAALDLVAWFTLAPASGPQTHHLPIHQQLIRNYNESVLLLAFHPSSVADDSSRGGKLPLTIYETVYEAPAGTDDQDMQASGIGPQHILKFQELPYAMETGEAEMIAVDFVARGGANAGVSEDAHTTTTSLTQQAAPASKGKGKSRSKAKAAAQTNGAAASDLDVLSAEDEDLIASLTAKANATRMLHQRIQLLKAYLSSLPPCYLNQPPAAAADPSAPVAKVEPHAQISHPILRSVASLLARLPLLTPDAAHAAEAIHERTDAALVGVVSGMGRTLRDAQEMGRKAGVVEHAKSMQRRTQGGPPLGGMDGWDDRAGGGAFAPDELEMQGVERF